jgi:hypothetical protein
VYEKVSPYLTVHSDLVGSRDQGSININTAEAVVLQTLPSIEEREFGFPISEDLASKIMEARPFEEKDKQEKLKQVSGIPNIDSNFYATKSHYFTVISSGTVGGFVKTARVVVKRAGNNITAVFWKVE